MSLSDNWSQVRHKEYTLPLPDAPAPAGISYQDMLRDIIGNTSEIDGTTSTFIYETIITPDGVMITRVGDVSTISWSSPPHQPGMEELEKAINQSREILDFGDNWDGEGSPGYELETWERATSFLRRVAERWWADSLASMPIPRIYHGPDGGIDIRWRFPDRRFLLTIPKDHDEPVLYFGKTGSGATTEGEIDLNASNEWIIAWLRQ